MTEERREVTHMQKSQVSYNTIKKNAKLGAFLDEEDEEE